MPVHKQGSGYQWGESGKVYTGPDAKAKAARQGRAIKASQARAAEGFDMRGAWQTAAKKVSKKR